MTLRAPCPFCKSMVGRLAITTAGDGIAVLCASCDAAGPPASSISGAWARWNDRAAPFAPTQRRRPMLRDIVDAVASRVGINPASVRGMGRTADLVRARDVVVAVARELGYSTTEIARALGGRDHTTICFAVRRVSGRSERDEFFAEDVSHVRAKLGIMEGEPNGVNL